MSLDKYLILKYRWRDLQVTNIQHLHLNLDWKIFSGSVYCLPYFWLLDMNAALFLSKPWLTGKSSKAQTQLQHFFTERNESAKSTGGVQLPPQGADQGLVQHTHPHTKYQMDKTKLSWDQQLGATSCSYSRRAGPSSEQRDHSCGGDKGNTTFNLSTRPTLAHLSPIHPSTTTKYHQVVFCKKKEHIVMKWCTMWLSLHAKMLFLLSVVFFIADFCPGGNGFRCTLFTAACWEGATGQGG